ncbi:hypothetical protein BUALT_Bualt06G0108200 [Buddleja alternifolia]|uniref:Citrate transporter-like domain-containing protein n=1 Tax=Buddleja alternifolia TaxID=168488 RepID=A0AAV6XL77_9LAMI|nr:hypothetical protein BUALT_Bualt06G0108200 [Buddleja alternifolia]
MAMAPTVKVVLGSIAFAIFWVLAVFPAVPFLPIGRTAGSLLGAMLMVLFRVITPDQAYAAIDLQILGLLFGTMPFLLALASSANIGSSATPIGNPQNLVIAVQSKISFGGFLFGILPAMLVGVVVNALILLCMYWKLLSVQKDEEDASGEVVGEDDVVSHRFSPATLSHLTSLNSQELLNSTSESAVVQSSPNVNGHTNHLESTLRNRVNLAEGNNIQGSSDHIEGLSDRGYFSESEIRKESSRNSDASKEVVNSVSTHSKRVSSVNAVEFDGFLETTEENFGFSKKCKRAVWKTGVYLVTLGMLVSYSLLIFFCGMFITVDGLNKTGIPSTLWELMEPYAKIDHIGGMAVLAAVIIVLSNVASNVPTVLLLGARMAASAAMISPASEKKAWLILAWVSTVARNLSLLGSAANLIVCEQARRAQYYGYNLSFWSHLKFGVPSTLIVTAISLILVRR